MTQFNYLHIKKTWQRYNTPSPIFPGFFWGQALHHCSYVCLPRMAEVKANVFEGMGIVAGQVHHKRLTQISTESV